MLPWRLEAPARAPNTLRYGVAVASVALALVLSLALRSLAVTSPFLLFFGAIAFSAWYGGLRPGFLATALSVLASTYFLLPPQNSPSIDDPASVTRVILFIIIALLINL